MGSLAPESVVVGGQTLYVGNHARLTASVTRQGRVLRRGLSFRIEEFNPSGSEAKCFHPGALPITCWLPVALLQDWS